MMRTALFKLYATITIIVFIHIHYKTFAQSTTNLIDTQSIQLQIEVIKSEEAQHPTKHYLKAKDLLIKTQQMQMLEKSIELLHLIGRMAHNIGEMDSAIYYFQLGIATCKPQSTWHNIAVFFTNIAISNHLKAQYKEAAIYYQKAIKFAKLFPPKKMPIEKIYGNYGVVFLELNLYDEAIIQLNKALKVQNSPDSVSIVLGALQNLGSVYKKMNDYNLAIQYYDSGIAIARLVNYYKNESQLLNNLAGIQLNQSKYNAALNNLLRAESISIKHKLNLSSITSIKANIGTAYLQLGNYKKAEEYLLNAFNSNALIPNGMKDVTGQLSQLFAEKKDFKKAYTFSQAYFKLKDSLQGEKVALQVSDLEKKYQSIEKDNEIIRAQLLVAEQKHKLEKKDWWIIIISIVSCIIIIAIITLVIWRNKRNKTRQAIEQLRSQIAGEERERGRLAKDLHDGVNSTLNGIKMYLNVAANQNLSLQENPVIIDELAVMLESATNDIRAVAHNLTPHTLNQSGLSLSIKYFCNKIFKPTAITTDIQIYEGIDNIKSELALSIYRIVQELVQNIVKHAKATSMILLLYKNEEKIVLLVEDNGLGFSENGTNNLANKGIGLSNIKERVLAHNGKLNIEKPESGNGVVVCIEFPLSA